MTTSQRPTRPWYCNSRLVDDHKASIRDGGDLRMYKLFKLLRAIIVNLGIIALAGYALFKGADPTISIVMSLAVLGAYNGLELGDYMALLQAYNELQGESRPSAADSTEED